MDPHIEIFIVIEEKDLRTFAGRLARERQTLYEVGCRFRVFPLLFIQVSVQDDFPRFDEDSRHLSILRIFIQIVVYLGPHLLEYKQEQREKKQSQPTEKQKGCICRMVRPEIGWNPLWYDQCLILSLDFLKNGRSGFCRLYRGKSTGISSR